MTTSNNRYPRSKTETRGVTRRQVLQTGGALTLGWGLWPLASMGENDSTPKSGGTLRVALGSGNTTDTYDPATITGAYMQAICFARCNCLTEIGPDGSVIPELAESWDVSPDARVWTFDLRKGVEFHNGKTLDSEDVLASINHHRGPDSVSAMKPILDTVSEMRTDGPSRIVFTLTAGNADFPYTLSEFQMIILPVIGGKLDVTTALGTGPYIMQEFEPGVRAFMTRNPNYWKENRAFFDSIEMLSIRDTSSRVGALLSGQADVIDRVDFKVAARLGASAGTRVLEVSGAQHYTFAMNTQKEPFNDVNVRLALKLAINRQQLVDNILLGHGFVGNDQPIGPSYRYFDSKIEQRHYDPDKARHYLEKAGLSKLSVSLSAADAAFPGAVDAASLYSEHASAAGINIQVVREPNDGYFSDVWRVKPFSAVYWRGRPTEDWMFSTTYAAGAPWNDAFWENERFNELLLAARAELDDSKRQEMYSEMQRLVRDDGGTVVPMFANYLSGLSERVRHPAKLTKTNELDGLRFSERWWLS